MILKDRFESIISHLVIDMDKTRLQTISQLQAFLAGKQKVLFTVPDSKDRRYAHIVTVAHRFGKTHIIQRISFTKSRPTA